MSKDFYRQFEDRHRGSRELILSRLQCYLPFIAPLQQWIDSPQAIDLGCGRGEWLELITQAGFVATGVDLDEQMLLACREQGLDVQCRDAISALQKLPANSQMLVSGFHLAEHLAFSDLQSLVQEAFRVLKTGGLLILETPNPENIVVGSGNFYLDPSHHHPLPPLLLSFLPEFYGFDRVKVLRLQEPLDLKQSRALTIHDVLGGVSPDYAVIAQKNSLQLGDDFLSQAFSHQYGISLEDVSSAYTDQLNRRFIDQNQKLAARTQELKTQGELIAALLAARTQELKTQGELIAALLARLNTLEKILAPLLWANRQRHALRQQGLKKRLSAAFGKGCFEVLHGVNCLLVRYPKIRQFIIQSLRAIGLHEWSQRQLNAMLYRPSIVANGLNQQSTEASVRQAIATMPMRTQTLYDEISCALEKQKKN